MGKKSNNEALSTDTNEVNYFDKILDEIDSGGGEQSACSADKNNNSDFSGADFLEDILSEATKKSGASEKEIKEMKDKVASAWYKYYYGRSILQKTIDYIDDYDICDFCSLVDDINSGYLGRTLFEGFMVDFMESLSSDDERAIARVVADEWLSPYAECNAVCLVAYRENDRQYYVPNFTENIWYGLGEGMDFFKSYIASRNKKALVEKGESIMKKALAITLVAGLAVAAVVYKCNKSKE